MLPELDPSHAGWIRFADDIESAEGGPEIVTVIYAVHKLASVTLISYNPISILEIILLLT